MVSVGCASTLGTRPRAGRFRGLEGWGGGHRRRPLFHWKRVLPPPRIGALGEGFLQVVEDLLAVLALYVRHVMALDHPGEALVPAVARHSLGGDQLEAVAGGAEVEGIVPV